MPGCPAAKSIVVVAKLYSYHFVTPNLAVVPSHMRRDHPGAQIKVWDYAAVHK